MADELILLTDADRALAQATTVPDLQNLHATFAAAMAWAKSRGLGVDAENKASEYILRTERRIGTELARTLPERREAQKLLGGAARAGREPSSEDSSKATLPEGITYAQSSAWQQLAKIPEPDFESMLAAAHEKKERIARYNFYAVAANSERRRKATSGEVPEDSGYQMFRAGIHTLLGWTVDDAGNGRATKNGLLSLPLDELLEMRALVELLAAAFKEAKARNG